MRILHTSDWHIGKVLKGVPRIDEQRDVLAEIVGIATEESVDLAVIAGDLFESAVPPPEAQALVWSTVLDLRETGAEVVLIAGNHDNGHLLEALSPLALAAGVHVLGTPKAPDAGGVLSLETQAGEHALVACLPFMSQRYVIRAAELMTQDAAENAGTYAERYRAVMTALCESFSKTTVNVVVTHGYVRGGRLGGGERDAQCIEDYWVDATSFPPSAQYVALGHLHRTQPLPGGAPIWYCGSPIQIDFGEGGETKNVLLVDVVAGRPARVTERALTSPRHLRTIEGTLAELRSVADGVGDDLLRVIVTEPGRAGLAAEVRELLPNAIDVRLQRAENSDGATFQRSGRSPHELFSAFLAETGVEDARLERLFASLLDDVVAEQL
jgi:DNA repair protein SbcD/Mre11